jgi:hypothetical protein
LDHSQFLSSNHLLNVLRITVKHEHQGLVAEI